MTEKEKERFKNIYDATTYISGIALFGALLFSWSNALEIMPLPDRFSLNYDAMAEKFFAILSNAFSPTMALVFVSLYIFNFQPPQGGFENKKSTLFFNFFGRVALIISTLFLLFFELKSLLIFESLAPLSIPLIKAMLMINFIGFLFLWLQPDKEDLKLVNNQGNVVHLGDRLINTFLATFHAAGFIALFLAILFVGANIIPFLPIIVYFIGVGFFGSWFSFVIVLISSLCLYFFISFLFESKYIIGVYSYKSTLDIILIISGFLFILFSTAYLLSEPFDAIFSPGSTIFIVAALLFLNRKIYD